MMMRWIFAIFMIGVGFYLLKKSTARNLAIRRILFVLFVFAGLVSLLFQNYWAKVSEFLGVESGTALLTYLVTFTFIASVISNYAWRRELEEKITTLAREIAILNSEKNN